MNVSVSPAANSLCDLAGSSYGVGGDAGIGLEGAGGQVTYSPSSGPTISVSPFGVGAGISGYGVYNFTTVNVINQGNLYQWLGF